MLDAISLAPFFDGSLTVRQATAEAIAGVYAIQRFFCVRDHGVPDGLAAETELAAGQYFRQPIEAKLDQLALDGCGYLPSPGLIGMPQSDVSPNELFLAHRDPERNPWPGEPLGSAMRAYNRAAEELAMVLLRALALGSSLPEDHFAEQAGETESFLKLFRFPAPSETPDSVGKYRLGEHHDYSAVSILRSAPCPNGLQVFDAGGKWIDAYAQEDALVILVGEQMTRWSDGAWMPTWHRVNNASPDLPGDGSRTSTCYFFNPECMADDVEAYLEGRADYARACQDHLRGVRTDRREWESPARRI